MPSVQEMTSDIVDGSTVANVAWKLRLSCTTVYNALNGKPVSPATRRIIEAEFVSMWREINEDASLSNSPGR